MSCRGKNRQALKSIQVSVTTDAPPPLSTRVTYLGARSLMLRGPATGRAYVFSADHRQEDVDQRDLRAILATGLFG